MMDENIKDDKRKVKYHSRRLACMHGLVKCGGPRSWLYEMLSSWLYDAITQDIFFLLKTAFLSVSELSK